MKATHQWLASYVDAKRSAREVADLLTMSGTECEHFAELGKKDAVMQFEITSNRVDCLGMLGLARELSALTGTKVAVPEAKFEAKGKTGVSVKIEKNALEKCPHYTARVIRGVKVGPSPKWLKERLEAIGVATINNVVDVTNYVLFEYSQPLHAFDLKHLADDSIIVRCAKKGEKFTAINHREYELNSDDLVIADAKRAVAIAGVMGGLESEVSESTVDVLLESAYFEPSGVKATGRKLDKQHSDNLDSDARYRFERGVDPAGVHAASDRAVALIIEVAGGEVEGDLVEAGAAAEPWLRELNLTSKAIERTLGTDVSMKRCKELLAPLGLEVIDSKKSSLTLRVPSYRRDLVREIDLVEEIARLQGLDQFEPRLAVPISPSRKDGYEEDRDRAHALMIGMGFDEVVSDAFVPAVGAFALTPWNTGPALQARSPINSACPALRQSIMPSLIKVFAHNERQGNHGVKLFETSGVTLTEAGGGWNEPFTLGIAGPDYACVKGAVDHLLARLRISDIELSACDFALFESGRGAELKHEGKRIGVVGEISKAAVKEFDLRGPMAVAELALDAAIALKLTVMKFEALPRFPIIQRDLALVLDEDVSWATIESICKSTDAKHLRSVKFFDEFRGKQVAKGKKSLAFNLVFRNDERTLTGEEIDGEMKGIIEALQKKTGGELRA